MAGLNKTERRAKELYLESAGADAPEWRDLPAEQKALWISRATNDLEGSDENVETVETNRHSAVFDDQPEKPDLPVSPVIHDPLSPYRNPQGSIKIEQPAPDRYVITGFRASGVFIPDVGHLAPPAQIDLPLNDETAAAVQAALDDYSARKEVARG